VGFLFNFYIHEVITMAYVANSPNAYDTNLIPVEVRAQYFTETLLQSPLTMFMGDSPESVIQVLNIENGSGTGTDFAFSRNIDYKNPVLGYGQITGSGQTMQFYTDRITVQQQSIADRLYGVELTKLTTPIDVYNRMKPLLQTAHNQNITYSLFKSATIDMYNTANGGNGPVQNRALYGGLEASYNASINAGVAALPAADAANKGGITVAGIRLMRDKAIYGGTTFESEKRITPYMLRSENGFPSPYYVYFIDTPSYTSLQLDPDWALYSSRGFKEMANQPTALSGSFFKGQIDNVLVYEVPELGNFQVAAGGKIASWNLFCGAQAFGLVWHKEPWFTQEWSNHNTVVEQALIEIRGQKSIMFPSFSNTANLVENGIIHNFVRIA
jgi:hypothetical protein